MDKSKLHTLLEQIKDLDKDHMKILVPTILSKTLSTYMLMREDLLFVKNNANLLINYKKIKPRNEQLEESLWYSLISLYGRCYTDASHSKKPKLDKKDIFKELEQTNIILTTHEKLFDIRNTFLAHRGDNENEYPIVYLKIPKNENISEDNIPFEIVTNRYSSESEDFLNNIIKLVEYLLPKIETKMEKCSDKLFAKVIELDKEILINRTIK